MCALKRRSEQSENKSSATFTNLDPGEWEGRLVYVADLGLHAREYKGEAKPAAQKIALGIEMVGNTVTIDGEEKPRLLWTKPFNIFHSLTEKGTEMKYYNIFEPNAGDGDDADWDAQLGKPVSVNVVHVKKDDATYDNISSLAPIPKKYQKDVGEATIEPCIGDADDEENACTKALYGLTRWTYDRRIDEGPTKQHPETHMKEPAYNDDDEIPF